MPVRETLPVRLGPDARRTVRRLAGRIRSQEPRLRNTRPFGPGVCSARLEGPALLLGDHTGVALREERGVPELEYRMLAVSSGGDVLALSAPRCPAFEDYVAATLGFGPVEVLRPCREGWPLWRRCMHDPAVMEALTGRADRHRRFTIVPYMAHGGVWRLAAAVAAGSRARVAVAGPPPVLNQRVNDKLWFARRVRELLGPRSVPEARAAHGPAALASQVAWFARRFDRVCLKLPSSAGSEGNATLEAGPLRRMGLRALRDLLCDLVDSRSWGERFPLLVGVWEAPVFCSPSVQLWIPEEGQDPVVEGVFCQVLEGLAGRFVGVAPSPLPQPWLERVAAEAALLGGLLQELGYFGRCSFDALVVGSDLAAADLLWIECNGRWGGTSLPMTLVSRLAGRGRRPPFFVADRSRLDLPPRSFARVLQDLDPLLLRPGRAEGVAFLAPTRLEEGTGFEFVAAGATAGRASELAREVMGYLAP